MLRDSNVAVTLDESLFKFVPEPQLSKLADRVPVDVTGYHNYDELTRFLHNMTELYPDLTNLTSIGKSVQGRELWVRKI